jgi:glutaminase
MELDPLGNSVRGVEFAKRLTDTFSFLVFSDLIDEPQKINPRCCKYKVILADAIQLCTAAWQDDIFGIRRFLARGVDINRGDYDGRRALHLAASCGHAEALRVLLNSHVVVHVYYKWNRTPLMDVETGGYKNVVALLGSVDTYL